MWDQILHYVIEMAGKKDYIELLKRFREEKVYEHLGIRNQNLLDQASRLKTMELDSTGTEESRGWKSGLWSRTR